LTSPDALLNQLIIDPFPEWSRLSLVTFCSSGTDNVVYNLGNDGHPVATDTQRSKTGEVRTIVVNADSAIVSASYS
jgi:hypothetical protein